MAVGNSDNLLTIAHVAKLVHRSSLTIRRWVKAGELNAIRLPDQSLLIRESELQRFLRDHEVRRLGS